MAKNKFGFGREFYIPRGATKVTQKDGDGVVYLYTTGTNLYGVVAFHGERSAKPDFHYTYRAIQGRDRAVKEFFDSRVAWAKYKADNKAATSNAGVNVGDIFVASWGYDQTNVDFYKVVELVGKASVVVRAIGQVMVEATGPMAEKVTADPAKLVGKPVTRRISNNYIKIDSVRTASKWDGRDMYQSHYH